MAESATLQIIIDAQNKADKTLNEVHGKLGGLKGKIEDMAPAFKGMAAVGGVAFAGITAVIKTSIDAANEAAKVQAQLGAVLKSTGGVAGVTKEAAIELSKALQKQTTFGDEAVLSAENILLTFTKIGKDIFPQATQTVLDMSVALGQDTKSSAIQLGKALQDPILGVSALRRVGVNFSQDQQDVIKKLVETGHAAEAQNMIMKELATEFGGSAAAQTETFAGKMQQLKEKIGDVQENIGNALLPILTRLLEKITPVIDKILDWTEKNPELTEKILLAAGAVAGLVTVVGALGLALPAIITGVQAAGTVISFFAATPLGAVIAALGATALIIKKVIDAFYDLKNMAADAAAAAQQALVLQQKADAAIAKGGGASSVEALQKAKQQAELSQKTNENIANKNIFQKIGIGLGIGSYDTGGMVPGPLGSPQLAIVHGGERVLTAEEASSGAGNMTFIFNGDITDKEAFIRQIKNIFNNQFNLSRQTIK